MGTNLPIPKNTPVAKVSNWQKPRVRVHCPYCEGVHDHQIAFQAHKPQWRAPGCGIIRSGDDRLTGYVFKVR